MSMYVFQVCQWVKHPERTHTAPNTWLDSSSRITLRVVFINPCHTCTVLSR